MTKTATVRRKSNLPVIESCHDCQWLKPCGGYRGQPELFANSCFARHCCGGRDRCNYLCPKNPNFVRMMNEVKGLRFASLPELIQSRIHLPGYVPSVLHRYSRQQALNVPIVAIPVEEVMKIRRGHMRAIADSPEGLRDILRLDQATRVVLNCIRKDNPIEMLWENWVADKIPDQLRPLGIELVIAPNFSHLSKVPRLECVGNRMRQLICVRDLSVAELPVVPHLSAVDPQDWDFWLEWLQENRTVTQVAFEFETGYKSPIEGLDALFRLAEIQLAVGRDLHLIVVGGTQYRAEVRRLFRLHTFIDGSPFWNTLQRQRARLSVGQLAWSQHPTSAGQSLDDLMAHNFRVYGEWMAV